MPERLWEVTDRKDYMYTDDPEDSHRIHVEWTNASLPDDLLKRLMNEIEWCQRLIEENKLVLSEEETANLNEVYRRLTSEGSNPYPRLVGLPEPTTINRTNQILPISLGHGKYGISLITEKNLDLPSAEEFREHHILHSLPVRTAYVYDVNPGETWVEFQKRDIQGSATWKDAWDVGAAGYVDPIRHIDPFNNSRVSLWQTCCDEIEKELNIPRYELPHRDNCHFFGTSLDLPTRHINILGYCHGYHVPNPERKTAPLVSEYGRCRLTPDEVARFIVERYHWVPCAVLTLILTLEAKGFAKQDIERAFRTEFSRRKDPINLAA